MREGRPQYMGGVQCSFLSGVLPGTRVAVKCVQNRCLDSDFHCGECLCVCDFVGRMELNYVVSTTNESVLMKMKEITRCVRPL